MRFTWFAKPLYCLHGAKRRRRLQKRLPLRAEVCSIPTIVRFSHCESVYVALLYIKPHLKSTSLNTTFSNIFEHLYSGIRPPHPHQYNVGRGSKRQKQHCKNGWRMVVFKIIVGNVVFKEVFLKKGFICKGTPENTSGMWRASNFWYCAHRDHFLQTFCSQRRRFAPCKRYKGLENHVNLIEGKICFILSKKGG